MRPSRPAAAAALLLILHAAEARSAGYGLYFEYGNVFDAELHDVDHDEDHIGGGLSFDTNESRDDLLNYRVDLGSQHVDRDGETGNGVVLDNTLGFGVLRTERMRLWLGPALRLSFDFSKSHQFGSVQGDDQFTFGIGVGPVVGLNLHMGDNISLALTGGYSINYVLNHVDGCNDPNGDGCSPLGSGSDGYENPAFFKVYVFLRSSGDRFEH